jgi:CheY-like chemotaxis protein
VIELHGGRIQATSGGLTTGSEFVVWLPVLGPEGAGASQPASRPGTRPPPIETRRRRQVLVVDDHPEIGVSLARLLRALGHEVSTATTGLSALALADSFQPDCAILDISLPDMSGLELGRRLREKFPRERLLMIALTGFGDPRLQAECLGVGFDAHLVKPGDIHTLAELLGRDRPPDSLVGPQG